MAQSNEFMNYILNRSTEYTEQGQVKPNSHMHLQLAYIFI